MQTKLDKRENENTIATQYFHGKERFNCCQAVLKAYSDKTGATDEQIREHYGAHGGGRAPGGLCGALHAACELLDEEKFAILLEEFEKKAGAKTCRDIRTKKLLACVECVELVARLLKDLELNACKESLS